MPTPMRYNAHTIAEDRHTQSTDRSSAQSGSAKSRSRGASIVSGPNRKAAFGLAALATATLILSGCEGMRALEADLQNGGAQQVLYSLDAANQALAYDRAVRRLQR